MGCGTVRGAKIQRQGDSPIKENKVFIRRRINEQFSGYFNRVIQEECARLDKELQVRTKPARIQQTLTESEQQTLLDLVRVGKVEKVQMFYNQGNHSLLQEIGNPNHFWTSLHFASFYGHSELLGHLIAALYREDMENFEENINYQTREGYTILTVACIQNHAYCALQIIRHGGTDLEIKDVSGQSALDHANYLNNYEALCAILQNSRNSHELNLQVIRNPDKRLEPLDYGDILLNLERHVEKKQIVDNGDLPTDKGALSSIR